MSTAARIDELRNRFLDNPRRYFASYANELRRMGALDEAIAVCREHLPQVPGHMSGYIVFGQTLFEADQLQEARRVFEQALVQDPENLIALRHLGDIDRRLGDAAAARRWYERVLEADPRNDDIAAQLATLTAPVPPVVSVTPRIADPVADEPLASALSHAGAPAAETTAWSSAEEAPDPSDPFGFGRPSEDAWLNEEAPSAVVDGEAFEEGLVAPEWPDTSDLADRVAAVRRPEPTPVAEPALNSATHEAFGAVLPWATPVTPAATAAESVAERASDDLPAWLRTPPSTPAVEALAPVSFADVHPDVPVTPAASTPISSPAFVTATMGELFVSQGFLDRAVSVFEELVRQRPDDPALVQRLAELRGQMVPSPGRSEGRRTVRQRFAALAARRVGGSPILTAPSRVAPAVISVTDDLSLDALFGNAGTADDQRAAQAIAEAFKPVTETPADFVRVMDQLPAQPVPDIVTPSISHAVSPREGAVDAGAFDRFFPDPARAPVPPAAAAKAADDLAEFSAWLKGLGSP